MTCCSYFIHNIAQSRTEVFGFGHIYFLCLQACYPEVSNSFRSWKFLDARDWKIEVQFIPVVLALYLMKDENPVVGYSASGRAIRKKQFVSDLKVAEKQIERGEYTTIVKIWRKNLNNGNAKIKGNHFL